MRVIAKIKLKITNNLRSLGSVIDDTQRNAIATTNQAANRTFVLYYDQVKAVFDGNEPHPSALADNRNGWIYEGSGPISAEYFQMNSIGHKQMANALVNFMAPLIPPISAPISPSMAPPVKVAPVPNPVRFIPVPPPLALDPTTAPGVAPTTFFASFFRSFFNWLFQQER